MKVGSLFSGVGGIDLAFERAGFTVAWQVEWNKDAQSVLRRHWPHVPLYGDITTVDPTELDPVDVIAFGSPCQDLSVAGKRAGLGGERSGLFYEAIRIIAVVLRNIVRPKCAIRSHEPRIREMQRGLLQNLVQRLRKELREHFPIQQSLDVLQR